MYKRQEHTPPGGTVTVSAEGNPLYTELCIEDTGEGIDLSLIHIFHRLSSLLDAVSRQAEALENALAQAPADGALDQAEYYRDKVIPAMTALRLSLIHI